MHNYVPNDPSTERNGNGRLHRAVIVPSASAEDSGPIDHEEETNGLSEDNNLHVSEESNTIVAPESPRTSSSLAVDRAPDERPPETESVVHETLRGLDVGLGFDYAALEKAADHAARSWAEKGLPRHDLEAQDQLDVEKALEHRARQIFWKWIRDVRRRVGGAISRELSNLTAALGAANTALESYRATEEELKLLNPRGVRKVRKAPARVVEGAETTNPDAMEVRDPQALASSARIEVQDTVLARRHLRGWFWPLMIALVVAEFIGNAPVFTELFPPNAQVDRLLSQWLDASAEMTWTTGLEHVAGKLAARPEPAFLTLSVVVFLLFLGHHLGGDLRTWMSVRRRHPEINPALADRLKRQSRLVGLICGTGVVVAIAVLFVMRTTVEPTARGRYDQAEQRLQKAEAEHEKARLDPDSQDLRRARQNWSMSVEDLKYRENQLGYATSISQMNRSITGLNLVLVIVATVAGFYRQAVIVTADQKRGYLADEQRAQAERGKTAVLETALKTLQCGKPEADSLSEETDETADTQDRTLRISELRLLLRSSRLEMTKQLAAAHRANARGVQLINCEPMREWMSVASRLQSAIPRFRAENARLRSLDPRDIKAFCTPTGLEFTEPSYELKPEVAAQFATHLTMLNRLGAVCDQLSVGVRRRARPPSASQATGQENAREGGEIA